MESLTEIGRRHGTDKATEHGYTDHYDAWFAHLRDRPVRVLEIGIGGYDDPLAGGESLRMWAEYFPEGRIVGLDLFEKRLALPARVRVERGSQVDAGLLARIVADHGPFDIVIDDGSHVPRHVVATFRLLFPTLATPGFYVVEDTQTSYWPEFGGSRLRWWPHTSVNYFRRLVHGLNHMELDRPGYRPTPLDRSVTELRFLHDLVLVVKGDNTAASTMVPPQPMSVGTWLAWRAKRSAVRHLPPAVVRRARRRA
ncbi:MAG: class I SAM-dependent methyltransferase [Acidimicrobiales bacterium]|nr:class I SAM-dependent methyltransferase [Acidimicrobiales bacterium]